MRETHDQQLATDNAASQQRSDHPVLTSSIKNTIPVFYKWLPCAFQPCIPAQQEPANQGRKKNECLLMAQVSEYNTEHSKIDVSFPARWRDVCLRIQQI